MSLHPRTTRGVAPGDRPIALDEVRGGDGSHWLVVRSSVVAAEQPAESVSRAAREWIETDCAGGPFSWADGAAWSLIKRGDGRSVWRVTHRGATFFVKVYDEPSRPGARLRRWWHGSAAEREWTSLLGAWRRGADTIVPLAVGVDGRPGGGSALVTAAFGDGRSLADEWKQDDSHARRELVAATAALFAGLCRAGVRHRDLHPHNVLVARTGGRLCLALADLQGAGRRRRGTVSPAALAQLDQFFQRVATRSDRVRFVRMLQQLLSPAENPWLLRARRRSLLADVVREKARWGNKLARTRDRRLRGDGKYFARIRLEDGWTGRVVLQVARRHAVPAGDTPDMTVDAWRESLAGLVSPAGLASTEDGSSSACGGTLSEVKRLRARGISFEAERFRARGMSFEVERFPPRHVIFEVERFRPRGTIQALQWRWFGSPAAHEFARAHRLRHRDVAAALRLAALDRALHGRVREAILITAPSLPRIHRALPPTKGRP